MSARKVYTFKVSKAVFDTLNKSIHTYNVMTQNIDDDTAAGRADEELDDMHDERNQLAHDICEIVNSFNFATA